MSSYRLETVRPNRAQDGIGNALRAAFVEEPLTADSVLADMNALLDRLR